MKEKITVEKRYRLAALHSHPIQYFAPFYKRLAKENRIDLTVYYCSRMGAAEYTDPGFGKRFKWDIPLLEGYKYKFLKNYSPQPSINKFLGLINPGIVKELARERYDAIIIHGYALFTYLVGYIAAIFTNTPVMFRGEVVLRKKNLPDVKFLKCLLLRLLFSRTSAFLAIGTKAKEFYSHYGVTLDKMFFTPYSVDNESMMVRCKKERERKAEHKRELGIPQDLPVILFCGKLVKRKRPRDLVETFRELESKAGLIFVGDGPLGSTLEKRSKDLQNVRFLGFKNQSEIPVYYAISDIFVLPSASGEVSPLVINEAMCCGLPIVVSDAVPSAVDFVKHGENGFIYPVGDVKTLASYIDKLLREPYKRKEMGERSLEIISAWNYDKCVEGILGALNYITREKYNKSSFGC